MALVLTTCQGAAGEDARSQVPTASTTAASPIDSAASVPAHIQEGNDGLRRVILTGQGNGIGDLFPLDRHPKWGCPPPRRDWSWTHVEALGLSWVRTSLDRMDWEQARDQDDYSYFHVNACQDEMVSLFARNGITMVYTIVYWDDELNANRPPDLGDERELQLHLDYARFLVNHLKDRIGYWEILNEAIWYVDLPDYLELIRRVVPIIREEDPDAKIIAGGASDLRHPINRDYLFGLLRSDVVPMLDGIVWHPMYGASPEYEDSRRYYEEYPELVRTIEEVAETHGFTGEYLAEEMGWRTSEEPSPYEPWGYTPIEKAKYTARAIVMHRGMGIWAGIGVNMTIGPFVRVVRNLGIVLDGAVPEALDVRIQTDAGDVLSYGFALPDGDRMLALWTNGVAVDDDRGVPATLTFSGDEATEAIGINVLEGFQQELITTHRGADLVIDGLLLKDYPIFVRLTA
jgi:hypothetical protein